jgi:CPA1 family monovalent cation:H+ antiporter
VPLIAPKKAAKLRPEHEVEAVLDIYRSVIVRLIDSVQPEQKMATEEVVQQYYGRISKAKKQNDTINERDALVRMRIIEWEREHTLELIEQGEVSTLTGMFYLDHLSRILARLTHRNTLWWEIKGFIEQIARRFRQRRQLRATKEEGSERKFSRKKARLEVRDLINANYYYVRERLEKFGQQEAEDATTVRAAALILIELERRIARSYISLENRGANRQEYERRLIEVEAKALEFEREAISDSLEEKRISRATAKEMRDNVAMMELDIEEQLE